VVRLKGGDPLIFGRADEEIAACKAANIAVDIVPGITAAQGAAARLGLPLTGRGQARRLQYITGHAKSGKLPDDIDWRSLADAATTTAIYMPVKTLAALVARAVSEGLDPATPAIAIASATRPNQTTLSGRIGDLPMQIESGVLSGPVLVLLGRVCEAYSSANATGAEPASQLAKGLSKFTGNCNTSKSVLSLQGHRFLPRL
jgi:uroporphyrin-III C-methyltransferase/precorrin-2 dehydrogenase/sirohydrochlorin ferrochelatase